MPHIMKNQPPWSLIIQISKEKDPLLWKPKKRLAILYLSSFWAFLVGCLPTLFFFVFWSFEQKGAWGNQSGKNESKKYMVPKTSLKVVFSCQWHTSWLPQKGSISWCPVSWCKETKTRCFTKIQGWYHCFFTFSVWRSCFTIQPVSRFFQEPGPYRQGGFLKICS